MATVPAADAFVPGSSDPLPGDQSRARYPHTAGFAESHGGRVAYEVYGEGEPALMFVPPWQIVHSRIWKAQIPDFARRHRVIAWDARGNGRSDRPTDPEVHGTRARAEDLLAVLDATSTERAILVSLSSGAGPSVVVSAEAAERVIGAVFVAPSVPIGPRNPDRNAPFEDPLPDASGWRKENLHFWRRDFRAYLEFFFGQAANEPHSTKQVEDGVDYGLATDLETLAATVRAPASYTEDEFRRACASISCPCLVIQGTNDMISGVSHGTRLAEAIPGAELVLLEGAGHLPNARDPIVVNLLIRDFVRSVPGGVPR